MLDLLTGRIRAGTVVTLTAAGAANATGIFTVSTFASMVGTKTIVLKRLKIQNNAAGNTWVHIGTGAAGAFVHLLPAIYSVNDTLIDFPEYDLPQVESAVTITAYPDAIGTGTFGIQLEVEERG